MAMNNVNDGYVAECPPAPAKRRPETSGPSRSNLQEEPACARPLLHQDRADPNGPVVECPGAPSKARNSESGLGTMNGSVSKNVRLSVNRGILPRPFQSRARMDILRQSRNARNMRRVMGVDDPAQNLANLIAIHRSPLNRAGNPAAPVAPATPAVPAAPGAPVAPRKSNEDIRLRLHALARRMAPRTLEFESSDSDNDSEDSGYGGRRHELL